MRTRAAAILAGALATTVAAPATVHASTVQVRPCDPEEASRGCQPTWVFTAAPGEHNDLTITSEGYRVARVRDTGARLEAGAGCEAVSEHEAICRGGPGSVDAGDGDDRVAVTGAVVDLGDGDDRLEGGGQYVTGGAGDDTMTGGRGARWNGGPGDDVLQAEGDTVLLGGPGADTLTAGDGEDFLIGGPGDDTVHGGGGDDIFSDEYLHDPGAGPDDDLLDGGEGNDAASYARRTAAVSVDLADPAPDGSAGERDRLVGVETVVGGRGDDVLTGDNGDNGLFSGPGHDVVSGGDGADTLEGGEGFDRYSAGAGNDIVDAGAGCTYCGWYQFLAGGSPGFLTDPSDEPVDCGPGEDLVQTYLDSPEISCESARFGVPNQWAAFRLRAVVSETSVAFQVPCPRPLRVRRRCRGVLTVRAHHARERRRFSVRARGGAVRVMRWLGAGMPPERIQVRLRYDAPPGTIEVPGRPYGVNTYMTLDATP